MSNGSINYNISVATGTAMSVLSALRARMEGIGKGGLGAFKGITAPIGGLVRGIGALNQAMEGVGRLMAPLGMVKDGLLSSVEAAAKMEGTKTAFEVMIGSAEKAAKTLAELKKLGAETPFEFTELADAGQLLLNFNVQAENLADTLRRIGDVSAVRNNLSQVAMIFGQVKVKTKLTGEEMMQFAEAGVPMLSELAKMLGTTEANVTKLSEAGQIGFPLVDQAFSNMTAAGGKFHNMMQKQSETTGGIWSNLKDKMTMLQETLGKPINDALRPILNDAIAMAEQLKPKMQAIGESIRGWLDYLRAAFKQGFGFEALTAELELGLLNAASAFGDAMSSLTDSIGAKMQTWSITKEIVKVMAMVDPNLSSEETASFIETVDNQREPKSVVSGKADGLRARIAEMHRLTEASEKQAKIERDCKKAVDEFNAAADAILAAPGAKMVEGAEKALKKAQSALDQIGGGAEKLKAMLDYQKQVDVARLKLQGLNKEAEKLTKEQQLREKIAEIMQKTGTSYEAAAKAAKLLQEAEKPVPERKTGTQIAEDRRKAHVQNMDQRRMVRRDATKENNEARDATRKVSGIDWLKANRKKFGPGFVPNTNFDTGEAMDRANKRVIGNLDPKKPEKDISAPIVGSIEKMYNLIDRRLATV